MAGKTNVITFNAPGPPGPPGPRGANGLPGPAGNGAFTGTGNTSLAIGKAVVSINGALFLASSTALAQVSAHAGLTISSGLTVQFAPIGPIDPNVFKLSVGVACAVGTDIAGNPVRASSIACVSGRKFLGDVDVEGQLNIRPRVADVFDPVDFGANSIDPADIAFAAMILNMPVSGGKIQVSDIYHFNNDLILNKAIDLGGVGRYASGKLSFAADMGIRITPYGDAIANGGSDPSYGKGSRVHDIQLFGATSSPSAWSATTHYAIGDKVYPVTGDTGVTGRAWYHMVCTVSGTSSGTEPAWSELDGSTKTDGDVTWQTKVSAAVFTQAQSSIQQCFITGFTDGGITVFGDVTQPVGSDASGSVIVENDVEAVHGDGITIWGNDANACIISTNIVQNCGGMGIRDRSFLGGTYVQNLCEENTGINYWSGNGVAPSTFVGNYSEAGGSSDVIKAPAQWYGGETAGFSSDSSAIIFNNGKAYPFRLVVPSSVSLTALLGYTGRQAVLSFQRTNETYDISLQWDDTNKRWQLIFAGAGGFESLQITGPDATQGPNRIILPDGFIAGRGTSQKQMRWLSSIPDGSSSDFPVRLWSQGDIVWNATTTAGGAPGWVCTTGGGWGGGRQYSARSWGTGKTVWVGDGIEPSTPNTFVYICTNTGGALGNSVITSGAEPTWPLIVGNSVTGADGITWKNYGSVGATFKAMASVAA